MGLRLYRRLVYVSAVGTVLYLATLYLRMSEQTINVRTTQNSSSSVQHAGRPMDDSSLLMHAGHVVDGDVSHQGALSRMDEITNMRNGNPGTEYKSKAGSGLSKECVEKDYGDLSGWPKASVILPFCENELLEDVLHTVHSIVQRSPAQLLQEIILIDDYSVKADFKELLPSYCEAMFGNVVRIFQSNRTLGLIQARLLGSRLARGDVIVTMDAHMEVQEKWLQALIYEIRTDNKTMASATLDWMSPTNKGWEYKQGPSSYLCVFSWNMVFGFGYPRPDISAIYHKDPTTAFPGPCSIGAIWAIDKAFFREIGELDEGMQLWGGENLELPLRVWLFGGRHVQVPCAHAAHLERPHQRDYRGTWRPNITHNYRRVIEVWFDQYKIHAYRKQPGIENADFGDITSRLEVKKKALHDFSWFLRNVYPELGVFDNYTLAYDRLKNLGRNRCVHKTQGLIMWNCLGADTKEGLYLSDEGHLRTDLRYWDARPQANGTVPTSSGVPGTYKQTWHSRWLHWKDGPMMVYQDESAKTDKDYCLEASENELHLSLCDPSNRNQHWQWLTYTKDYNAIFTEDSPSEKFDPGYRTTLLQKKKEWDEREK